MRRKQLQEDLERLQERVEILEYDVQYLQAAVRRLEAGGNVDAISREIGRRVAHGVLRPTGDLKADHRPE